MNKASTTEFRNFQNSVEGRIADAIDEILEEASAEAEDLYLGRPARIKHRWSAIDPLIEIEGVVSRVQVSTEVAGILRDATTAVEVELAFEVIDPRTGKLVTLNRHPINVEFL
jgi:hypothetical protein